MKFLSFKKCVNACDSILIKMRSEVKKEKKNYNKAKTSEACVFGVPQLD